MSLARLALSFVLSGLPVLACLCEPPADACSAAGRADAVFVGRVLELAQEQHPPAQAPIAPGIHSGSRIAAAPRTISDPMYSKVQMEITEGLMGVPANTKTIEVENGPGECGVRLAVGESYLIYAVRGRQGSLRTSMCLGTRPLEVPGGGAQGLADRDIQYFRNRRTEPELGELTVQLRSELAYSRGGSIATQLLASGESTLKLIDEYGASQVRRAQLGSMVFTDLVPGEYKVELESDGASAAAQAVTVRAWGCSFATLTLRSEAPKFVIRGTVKAADGRPLWPLGVELVSTDGRTGVSGRTGPTGEYLLQIDQPGTYYLGINLAQPPSALFPFPSWYYPGTADPAQAERIEIPVGGSPSHREVHLTAPMRIATRVVAGTVSEPDGSPAARAKITAVRKGSSSTFMASADESGRFRFEILSDGDYTITAFWPGPGGSGEQFASKPTDVPAGGADTNLELALTEPWPPRGRR